MAGNTFTFPFQKVLDFREHQEKGLEIELSGLDEAILQQKQTRSRWELTRQQLLEEIGEARREGELRRAADCADYLQYVRDKIRQCERETARLQGRREEVRQELERVMRARKVVENYRDRLKKEFLAEREKIEQKVIDLHSSREFIQAEDDR